MGREAQIRFGTEGQSFAGKALLESRELVLRAPGLSQRHALADLSDLRLDGEALCFRAGHQTWYLQLGRNESAKWLRKIQAGPPSLASKLGISETQPAAVFGPVQTDPALAEALVDACSDKPSQASVLLALVLSQEALAQALILHAQMPCQALWLVYEKGPRAAVGEGFIRQRLRELGYRDHKSCAVSERLTATRYRKP